MNNDAWVERILRVVDHVQSHLDDELDPKELARIAGFSLHHFHRVFRGMVGESVMGFVRRLRLERAAMRLKFGDESVTRLAFDAGYDSHEGFTRAFRARFGVPPSKFREESLGSAREAGIDMSVRSQPEYRCVAHRFVGPYEECTVAWEVLTHWAMSRGLMRHAPESFGLAWDDPEITDADKIRYDALLAFDDATIASIDELPPSSTIRTIPAGRYALAVHCGSYEVIEATYVALLGQWLPKRGVELRDEPVVEHYLNDPMSTPPADLRTEVCVRLS